MTAPTTSHTVLDHVRSYAAQVRDHLADLAPEQVEDLTDGLEADLAEALADSAGPVATGEVPVVGRAGGEPRATALETALDLTARFGPAATYAAELRASAGLGESAAPGTKARRPRRPGPLAWLRVRVAAVVRDWREALAPFLRTPQGAALRGFVLALAPVWWVGRAWVWFVVVTGLFGGDRAQRLLPSNAFMWLVLLAFLVGSVNLGRHPRNGWRRRLLVAASLVAVLWGPWALGELRDAVAGGLAETAPVEYIEVPVYQDVPAEPEDGVYVDGMLVSNLFVYDAEGNPLDRVQIFDDRGRPVRTTMDEGTQSWFMPGVDEPWRFGPDLTADGRERWNVYPLRGVPMSEAGGESAPGAPDDLRLPPLPFAQAPTLVDPSDGPVGEPAGGTGAEQGGDGS